MAHHHDMDILLDESSILLRNTVHQFAEQHITPLAQSIDATNQFPRALWPELGKLGLLGITVPEAYGGSGMGYLQHAVAMAEITRASAAIGLSYGAHSNLCLNQITLFGTETQKKRYLPALCRGEHVGALAMSESGSGSDVVSMQLSATASGDDYLLNGTKMWITNGPEADVLIVYAKTNPELGAHGMTAFIIEKNTPGFSTAQKLDKLGMRGSDTCELVFNECRVPKTQVLGDVNQGIKVLMHGLNIERVILAAGPVGIMAACLDLVLPYVHQRKQFGHYIGEFQLIKAKLADMYTALNTSQCYLYTAAKACDQDQITSKVAASVILYTAEQATHVALDTIQCLGGNGYINDYPAGRLLRDAKLYEIGAGTSEIRRLIIGRELFDEQG